MPIGSSLRSPGSSTIRPASRAWRRPREPRGVPMRRRRSRTSFASSATVHDEIPYRRHRRHGHVRRRASAPGSRGSGERIGQGLVATRAGAALRAGGLEPSLICGAVLRDLGTNAYAGRGDFLVIEADEYDHAFLSLEPEIAIVTNVEHDHVDVFPTHADVKRAFRHFVAGVI